MGDAAGGHRSPVGGFNGRHFGGDAGVAVPLVPADVAAAGPEALRPQRLHRRLRRRHLRQHRHQRGNFYYASLLD